uniref:hypothetical protein n=1 Tax=Agathobacter sp. TaxID=2021311 RepID=UPI004055F373
MTKNTNFVKKPKSVLGYMLLSYIIGTVIVCIFHYIFPTAWNIHAEECWLKCIFILGIYSSLNCLFLSIAGSKKSGISKKKAKLMFMPFLAPVLLIAAFMVCGLAGAEIFHSSSYAQLIQVQEVSSDMILSEEDAESIALMDTASARQLGDREIGAIENFSAFNVSEDYVQLNVREDAVKIAPLEYVGFFKWMNNKDKGVTGYVSVSPTTMTADYVELEKGLNYVPSAYFGKDLYRHLHYQFPTKIMGNIHFEIDEDGKPYYITSVFGKTIGVFGGEVVIGAIITDPVSGESEYYEMGDIPQWVDYVVPGELICELYNVSHKNINGFWNGTSFGANTGCMQTTTINSSEEEDDEDAAAGTDFGYIAKEGDIYVYTGVTSMAADSSNLGFIMVNERTGEYRYVAVSSANEQSAMNAAEGEVQQYGYKASFPTLINVDNELSYIGVLKDQSGLVKMYYIVNVKDYGKVAVADTRETCVSIYADKLGLSVNQDLPASEEVQDDTKTEVSFAISVIRFVDVDGNTYVYMGTEDGTVYKAVFHENEELLFAEVGDTITGYLQNDKLTVEKLETIPVVDKF